MNSKGVAWAVAFVYLGYAALSDIPALSNEALFSVYVSSALFVALYLYHSFVNLGARTALKYLGVASVLGYSFEYLFITTGLIGRYVYTADLAPLLGPVPVFIPLLWAALSYFCLIAARNVLASSLLMVLLDVSFDPRFSLTLWHWITPGQYFGVPLSNFVGWFVTAATIYGVFFLVTKSRPAGTKNAVFFYLGLGLFNGALPDLIPGLYLAGEISIVLFGFSALALLVYLQRDSKPPAPGKMVLSPQGPTRTE